MSEADTVQLADLVDERTFQRIYTIEVRRARDGGPQKYHQDEISQALRHFLVQHPATVEWCRQKDESNDMPSGTAMNVMLGTFSEVVGAMQSELMAMADSYSTRLPYPRMVHQCLILAMEELLDTIKTGPL